MRYLVYILAIANLVFFGWYVLMAPPAEPVAATTVPVPPGIDALVLLSERAAEAAPVPETIAPKAAVAARDPQDAQAIEKGSDEEVVAPVAPAQRVCRTVGPFLDKQDATSVFATLAQQGYVVSVRDGDVREPAGYWVYLPAMASKDARRIVADLDTHGMKDYFVGKQNHISLGIFSDKDKARTRQQTVKNLGYDAVLDQRYRARDVYWLDVEEKEQPLLGTDTWRALQTQHTDIRVQKVSCE